jgi:hypothetical protein
MVVVVVDGPFARDANPRAYWGNLGGTGAKDRTMNYAWTAEDRNPVT